jgi:hypothetical protein
VYRRNRVFDKNPVSRSLFRTRNSDFFGEILPVRVIFEPGIKLIIGRLLPEFFAQAGSTTTAFSLQIFSVQAWFHYCIPNFSQA